MPSENAFHLPLVPLKGSNDDVYVVQCEFVKSQNRTYVRGDHIRRCAFEISSIMMHLNLEDLRDMQPDGVIDFDMGEVFYSCGRQKWIASRQEDRRLAMAEGTYYSDDDSE